MGKVFIAGLFLIGAGAAVPNSCIALVFCLAGAGVATVLHSIEHAQDHLKEKSNSGPY